VQSPSFRRRAFRWLWVGVVAASVGSWAQTVGAQWLFVSSPDAATIVPLVQTATTLPMMLLALPAGVLADVFDRRWLMFAVQCYLIAVAALLAVLTAAGSMPPALLLAFTFAVGAGQAMLSPTWQALISELVPRSELAAATRLDMVSVNVSRAAGPALAGVVIARWGVPPVFALTAVSAAVLAVVLLAWRRPRAVAADPDPFLPALATGGRYVRNEPVVRRLLARFAAFVVPACAVWALLPLIASRQLGVAAGGYGLLFAALGAGAVAAALSLGRVKRRLSSDAVVVLAAATFGPALAGLALAPNLLAAAPLLLVCGYSWTATVSTVISELQLFLPSWVRARAIAVYLMVFLGSQAAAAPVWGLVTARAGLRTAVLTAGALVTVGVAGSLLWRVPDNQHLDRTPAVFWGPADIGLEPDPDAGPVLVSIECDVADDDEAAFLTAVLGLRRSRLRSGATRWELYRVGEHPHVFVEQFQVPSWREHLRQHDGRLTTEDADLEQTAFALVIGRPRARHYLPADTARIQPADPAAPDATSGRATGKASAGSPEEN
jgi:hypothetical protein